MDAHRFSLAPMMERTDRHFRTLMRAVTRRSLLYTEMVMGRAVVDGRGETDMAFDAGELPLALQVGDNDPDRLARCAEIATTRGFTELNLNCGCPSAAVRDGAFGARLMLDPPRVARCVRAMKAAGDLPVTVKHRIGVDDVDDYADMLRFVDAVVDAGVDGVSVHARKAWLAGLSPKQNRNVPPLRWPEVRRLAAERPGVRVELNGGVTTTDEVVDALRGPLAGVMVGREAYRNPMAFADVDQRVFDDAEAPATLEDVCAVMLAHAERWAASGGRVHAVARHVHGLFLGLPGGRAARRRLSESSSRIDVATLRRAVDDVLCHPSRRNPPREGGHDKAPTSA